MFTTIIQNSKSICYIAFILILFAAAAPVRGTAEDSVVIINDGYGDYVYVPAGETELGGNYKKRYDMEWPIHVVYLDEYYIGRYEVTNEQYALFLNEEGNQFENRSRWLDIYAPFCRIDDINGVFKAEAGYEKHPVVQVTWCGAWAYCVWLTKKNGHIYRLPTEQEWEKAARGNGRSRYPWGDDIDGSYANYRNSGDPYESGSLQTTPVGYYDGSTHEWFHTNSNASPYGAYDMAGNVSELCMDWNDVDYYMSVLENSKNAVTKYIFNSQFIRGGNWFSFPYNLHSTLRNYYYTYSSFDYVGFRCVREAELKRNAAGMPLEFILYQNYPNPFNGITNIKMKILETAETILAIFDIRGRLVRTLIQGYMQPGIYYVDWDCMNDAGQMVSSGVYFYRLFVPGYSVTKKMMLLK